MIRTFGIASRSNVEAIGASSRTRVRGSMALLNRERRTQLRRFFGRQMGGVFDVHMMIVIFKVKKTSPPPRESARALPCGCGGKAAHRGLRSCPIRGTGARLGQ